MDKPRTKAEGANKLKVKVLPAKNAPVKNQPATDNSPTPANTVLKAKNKANKLMRQCCFSQGPANCHQSFMRTPLSDGSVIAFALSSSDVATDLPPPHHAWRSAARALEQSAK